jgi:hypothetical protein
VKGLRVLEGKIQKKIDSYLLLVIGLLSLVSGFRGQTADNRRKMNAEVGKNEV